MSEIRLSGNPFNGTLLFERVKDGEVMDYGIIPVTQGDRAITPDNPAVIDGTLGPTITHGKGEK